MQPRWNRSQPFVDYILDCLEKARGLGFGKAITIYDNALLWGDMKVGKNIFIGTFIVLDGFGDLEIGDQFPNSLGVQTYVLISPRRRPSVEGRCNLSTLLLLTVISAI